MAKLLKDVTLKLTLLSSWESKNVEVDATLPVSSAEQYRAASTKYTVRSPT